MQSSEERLFKLESELKRSSGECNFTTMTPNHKSDKKIYADQFEFNVKIAGILWKALSSSDELELDKDLHLNQGIELITRRNKLLVLADTHGWEVVEAYTADPLADDSAYRKRSGKLRKRENYFATKSRGRPGCLGPKIETRRNRFGIFRDSTPSVQLQPLLPLFQSVPASLVGNAAVQATMQSFAKTIFLLGPTTFSALPSQGIPKPSLTLLTA